MKKQQYITEQTRIKLLDSFWLLYKKEDLSKITVKNICDVAGYERTTFYRYFTDIEDLFNQLENNIINSLLEKIHFKEKATEPFKISPDNFIKFASNYGEYIVIFYEKGNTSFCNKFKKLIKNDVYKYLSINAETETKKEFIFEFIFSSLINSFVYWYRHKKSLSIESFIQFANNILGINNSSIFL